MPNFMGKFLPPFEVIQRLNLLSHHIRVARVRRGWTIAELAEKTGLDRNTVNALELGKPGVRISALITVLWALGLDHTLSGVADPDLDLHGKSLEASRRPGRVRKPQAKGSDYDF